MNDGNDISLWPPRSGFTVSNRSSLPLQDQKHYAEFFQGVKAFKPWMDSAEDVAKEALVKPETLEDAKKLLEEVKVSCDASRQGKNSDLKSEQNLISGLKKSDFRSERIQISGVKEFRFQEWKNSDFRSERIQISGVKKLRFKKWINSDFRSEKIQISKVKKFRFHKWKNSDFRSGKIQISGMIKFRFQKWKNSDFRSEKFRFQKWKIQI